MTDTRMVVLCCGSRTWPEDKDHVISRVLERLNPIHVIHGGARGADQLAGEIADDLGFKVTVVKPDWATHGRSAGFMRNILMLEMGPSIVVAFWDGKSRGTAHTIYEATKRGIPVQVVHPDD